jgi:hypothetical protein
MRLRDFSSPSARYWGRSACARVVAKVPGTSSVHRAGTPRATKTERGGTRQTVVHAGMTLRRATPTTERMLLSAPRPHCQDVLWSSETPRQGTFTGFPVRGGSVHTQTERKVSDNGRDNN